MKYTKPSINQSTSTVAQFVAEFFSTQADDIDHGNHFGCDWAEMVNLVARGGDLLEQVIVSRKEAGEKIAEWYEILENAAATFKLMALQAGGDPPLERLALAFEEIVDRHLEK